MESRNSNKPSQRQFSFHRSPLESSNRQNTSFNESTLKHTLHKLPHSTLLQVCLESLEENQFLRSEHFKTVNKLITLTTQIGQLKENVEKKREKMRCLIQNQNKLTTMFEQHMKLCNKEEVKHEQYWQKKFKQLQRYMNQYVLQSNEVQEEYLKGFNRLKDENQRVYIEMSNLNARIKELEVQKSIGGLKEKNLNIYNSDMNEASKIEVYKVQNQKMRKQIQKFHQQKDRLEVDITSLHNDMESYRQKVRNLQIQNASLRAQMYLRRQNKYDIEGSQKSIQEDQCKSNNGAKRKHLLIPPLKIHESLQKIRQVQRSHSASYL